jgi:aryl-alcohol dehydrogenase-like predicted oxidoreductase
MKYRFLGNTGVRVSELCYGTMSFGGDADEQTSEQLYRACRDAGINFFDCANVYAGGESERILGRLMKSERNELVITSKVYFPTADSPNSRGSTRYHIVRAVEESLRRLDTDRIDLYFLHRFDEVTPMEESLRALDDLVRSGKVLYLGVSNFAAWQVTKANGIAALHNWAPIAALQPMYNLVKRQAEVELLPMAASEKLGVISYSPLGGGLLSGKYTTSNRPDTGRLVENSMYQTRYGAEGTMEAAEQFTTLAQDLGVHPASLALRWVSTHPAITAPIAGARNTDQLSAALASVDIDMDDELRNRISAITPTPPPATDRSEERKGVDYGTR